MRAFNIVGHPTFVARLLPYPIMTNRKVFQESGPWHPDPISMASLHQAYQILPNSYTDQQELGACHLIQLIHGRILKLGL